MFAGSKEADAGREEEDACDVVGDDAEDCSDTTHLMQEAHSNTAHVLPNCMQNSCLRERSKGAQVKD